MPSVVRLLRLTALAAASGVLAGLSSAAFLELLDSATDTRVANGWLLWLLPVAGLGVGLAYHHGGGRAAGGTRLIVDEIHEPTGPGTPRWVPRRLAPLVFGGTVVTHLFGGSAGREGTAIQMSGSLTDLLARTLRLDGRDRRVLLMAAISGGFGAVFGVPLAGWVFGLEVQANRRFRVDAALPTLVASVVGDQVVRGLGVHHTFLPPLGPIDLDAGLVGQILLAGVAFGITAVAFVQLTHRIQALFATFVSWPPARPLLGGVIVVLLTLIVGNRDYLGLSLPLIGASTAGGAGIIGGAFALKLVFTAVTLGAGLPGGEVTPLFVIGTTLGVSMAHLLGAPVPLLAALGFVAVFAGAANTPLACTIMGGELFGGGALVPFAIACVAAYIFSPHQGIYGARMAQPTVGAG